MQVFTELDTKILFFLNGLAGQSYFFDSLVVFSAKYIQPVLIVLFVLFLFFSYYSRSEKLRMFWVTAASVVIARFGITEIIRLFYYRPRPFLTYQLQQLIFKNVNTGSFPSGHAAFFFALATAVYLYNKKWGLAFLSGAVLMNISRVIAGVHYPSDILGGALIGTAAAYSVFYIAGKIKK